MSKETSPAVHKALSHYIEFINKEVIEQFGKSYMTPENIGNKWRNTFEYSIKTEQFLYDKTKLFINMLDSRDPKSSNPQFLKPLINEISDYLSRYIMRGRTQNRNSTTKEIKQVLWDNNHHIQYLLSKQQQQRDAANKKSYTKQQNKRKHIAKANFDYNIALQVKKDIIDTNRKYR